MWWNLFPEFGLFSGFLLVILLGLTMFMVEVVETGLGAFVVLGIGFLIYQLLSLANPMGMVTANWGTVVYLFAIYFLVGIPWSVIKWYFYLLNKRDAVKAKYDLSSSRNAKSFKQWATDTGYQIPTAYHNKARIIRWMAYWPFSLVWTLVNDPIRRIWNAVYHWLSDIYDALSRHVYKDLMK